MGNSSGKPIVYSDEVNLDQFRLLRVVGKGAFGKVRIVERKDTGLTFALKYIRKDEVVRSESVRNMIRERRMLEHLNHPFLCNLRYSFQDVEYIYIVVDLMTGGDLRFHITRKTFTEEAIRFWIAELGCALRYVHQQNIVHRDVKPDNVLLDGDGHVHLADFNVATDITPGKPLTSKSGTLAYLAPEVYRGKGYGAEADWWSLGVVYYECIYGKRPFEGSNHEQLAQTIQKASPAYPITNPPVSTDCSRSLQSLLEVDRSRRIGSSSWESFINHPFFAELNFDMLLDKQIEPIFKPSSDKTNFDATYDLEELLLEEAPLEARTRKQKPRAELKPDASNQEIRAEELYRMIETLFEPFNYTCLPEARNPIDPGTVATETGITEAITTETGGDCKWDNVQDDTPKIINIRERPGAQSPKNSPLMAGPPSTPLINSNQQEYFGQASRYGDSSANIMPDPALDYKTGRKTSTIMNENDSNVIMEDVRKKNNNNNNTIPDPAMNYNTGRKTSMTTNENDTNVIKEDVQKKTHLLGFLKGKRGRDRSPKPRERGVLGKEGARVIVGS